MSIFIRDDRLSVGGDDIYRRYQETHYQRAYSLERIQELIRRSGMELLAAYDAFTKEKPSGTSERVYIIAKEHGKRRI